MRLLYLAATDFLAYDEFELDLSTISELAIVGPVGAGKSSLLDMVLWSVWGRPRHRSVTVDDLIRHGQESCAVTSRWLLNDGQVAEITRRRSRRSRGESSLVVTLNGADGSLHTIAETQAMIETLVGLPLTILLAGPLMVQGQSDELMRLDPAQRKELLVQLLELDRYRQLEAKAARRLVDEEGEQAADEREVQVLEGSVDERPQLESVLGVTAAEQQQLEAAMADARAEVTRLTATVAARQEQRQMAEHLRHEIGRQTDALGRLDARSARLASEWSTRTAIAEPAPVTVASAADCEELARYAVEKFRWDDAQAWLATVYERDAGLIEEERGEINGTLTAYRARLAELSASAEADKSLERDLTAAQGRASTLDVELRQVQAQVTRLENALEQIAAQEKRLEVLRREVHSRALIIASLRLLDRAFGRDGIPTMVLEQAIPQLEDRANDVLGRMPTGFRLQLRTQRENRTSGTLRDTLDVVLTVNGYEQSYQLGSGGERMQVDFALRVALASLYGRFATLWIDEGWGSQDAPGRTAMVDAIRMVADDFGLVVAVSHVEDVADQFPHRLEVHKDSGASSVRLI